MKQSEKKIIDWNYPDPQTTGDKFIGPGATRAEKLLQYAIPAIFAIAFPLIAYFNQWGWSWIQYIVAALIAMDMMGGVITNATSSAKRWYHRKGQGLKQHMTFVVLHIIQLFLVMAVFDWGNWTFLFGAYIYLIVAALVLLLSPLYLQRPVAVAFLVGGVCLSLYLLPIPVHFEWFLPVFYIKLLVSHLLQEEPYRPSSEK